MLFRFFSFIFMMSAVALAALDISRLPDKTKLASLNTTTGGPYTYDQSAHHFTGVAYDGSYIDTTSACAGANDSCRNNPDCECTVRVLKIVLF